jgi:hypothetical protein
MGDISRVARGGQMDELNALLLANPELMASLLPQGQAIGLRRRLGVPLLPGAGGGGREPMARIPETPGMMPMGGAGGGFGGFGGVFPASPPPFGGGFGPPTLLPPTAKRIPRTQNIGRTY